MKSIILFIHIAVSIALVTLILLQSSEGGLGSAFGGGAYRTKRGAERMVFITTIVVAILFLITSVTTFLVK